MRDELAANGMVGMAMDYGKYFRMILPMNLQAAQPDNQARLDALKDLKGNVRMLMDVTKNGIELDSKMTLP